MANRIIVSEANVKPSRLSDRHECVMPKLRKKGYNLDRHLPSAPGQGSTFLFTLPVETGQVAHPFEL